MREQTVFDDLYAERLTARYAEARRSHDVKEMADCVSEMRSIGRGSVADRWEMGIDDECVEAFITEDREARELAWN